MCRLGIALSMLLTVSTASSLAADREPVYRGQTLDTWFAWLKSGDDDVRLQAVTAIGEFGPEARGRAAEFAAGLADKNRAVRLATAKHLASWQDAKSQGLVIQNTVHALEAMGERAKAVVPQLAEAYQQCDDADAKAAVGGLLKKLDADAAAKAGVE
jgi:hypothetical protein